jgi:hypothetical protein
LSTTPSVIRNDSPLLAFNNVDATFNGYGSWSITTLGATPNVAFSNTVAVTQRQFDSATNGVAGTNYILIMFF